MEHKEQKFILWFNEISKDDIPLVGGKNANLGEMYQNLTSAGQNTFPKEKIKVPYGFAVTAHAYNYFVKENSLDEKIKSILDDLNTNNIRKLEKAGHEVRELIMYATF